MTRNSSVLKHISHTIQTKTFGAIIAVLMVAVLAIFIGMALTGGTLAYPLTGAGLVSVMLIASWTFRSRQVEEITLLQQVLSRLSEGDVSAEMPEAGSSEDIQNVYRSIDDIRESVIDSNRLLAQSDSQMQAISNVQAVIEFDMDGIILTANDIFLNVLGYRLDEVQGQHHSMFVETSFRESPEYREFWLKLNRGEFETKVYKRLGKGGKEVWISASYNPIINEDGKPVKVVKYANDITEKNLLAEENLRIKTATDGASTNIMVADGDYNIVYMNKTMQEMMQKNEKILRNDLPNLDADNLVGGNIDIFYKDPGVQRRILDGLTTTVKSSIDISGLNFELVVNPIIDEHGKRAGTVLEWEDVTRKIARETEERQLAGENQRIKIALDNASTNVMVADADFNIVYMNSALIKMMQESEADLRKTLPNFNASQLIGTNIDVFHKNPAHQRGMLKDITTTVNTNIKVGVFDFNLIVNPVSDANGERLGTVVEWKDMTQELAIEEEINIVVNAAAAGDFTKRIGTEDKEGFMLNLANNVNTIGINTQAATDDLVRVLSELARGNLTEKIEAEYQGTFDLLKNSSNKTATQLMNIVSQVNQSAAEVATASAELSMGSDDLSRRTEAQASSLEETAASMEELAVTVKQNSENAEDANKLAEQSSEMANQGGEVAKQAVEAMSVIENSSQKVSDIIGVIDDLAFQTNLLALNAAVEAARAGEAGKGFAVVAEEVRTLAQRSAQASNEIKSLITSSNTQVKNGVELVDKAGSSLNDIRKSIAKVAEIVAEIASASSEQAQGIDEVNVAIAEMDDMTQKNSSLVEQSTASARVLERQAGEMQRQMSFFNVGDLSAQMTAAPAVHLQQSKVKEFAEEAPIMTPVIEKRPAANGAGVGWSEF